MNGADVSWQVPAGLSVEKDSFDSKSRQGPRRQSALQQRTHLAHNVPSKPAFHLVVIARSGLRARGQWRSGVRHRHRGITLRIEFAKRADRCGEHGDTNRRVTVIHQVVVRRPPVLGKVVPPRGIEHVDPHRPAEARRVDWTSHQNARGIRRVGCPHGDVSRRVPVVHVGRAADEELFL